MMLRSRSVDNGEVKFHESKTNYNIPFLVDGTGTYNLLSL